jgi:hypothetical protein
MFPLPARQGPWGASTHMYIEAVFPIGGYVPAEMPARFVPSELRQ